MPELADAVRLLRSDIEQRYRRGVDRAVNESSPIRGARRRHELNGELSCLAGILDLIDTMMRENGIRP